jgi:hypothetical protein
MIRDRHEASRRRDPAYWTETGKLVVEYLALRAGVHYSEKVRLDFVAWLERSPVDLLQYRNGEDPARAVLVDRFLQELSARAASHE